MPKSKGKTAASKKQACHPYTRNKSPSPGAAASSSSPSINPEAQAVTTTKRGMGNTASTPELIAAPTTATKKSKRKNRKSKNSSQADTMMVGVESTSPQETFEPNGDAAAAPNGHKNADTDATTIRTTPHTPENPAAAESSPTHKHKKEMKELETKLRTSEEGADALRTSVSELEAKMAAMKQELEKMETELGVKTKLLADQDSHVDKVKDAVSCNVCFEALDDPHVLTCGHSACRKCLVQWFRSGNAYRSEGIQEVAEGDDLTYRVKLCHMCREPVFNRPVRLFALQTVIETLGVHVPEAERDADPWKLTFPADPTSYSIADDADCVDRCPACLGEIAGGECQRCEAMFTDVDSESGLDDHSGSDMGDDDDDQDDDHVFDAVRNALGMPPRRGATPPERARDVRLTFSPSQPPVMPSFLDDIADEDDNDSDITDSSDSTDSDSDDPPPRRTPNTVSMSPSPPLRRRFGRHRHRRDRTPTLSRRNDVAAPDDEDLELDEAEGYESSFIDDTDDDDDGDDEGKDGDSEAEVNEAIEEEDEDEDEDDQPTIDELRVRRAARFSAPSAEGAEASTGGASGAGRRRKRIIESDEESD